MRFSLWLIIFVGSLGCEYFKPKALQAPLEPMIARVQGELLYQSDLEGLIARGTPREDSTKLVEKYVNDWIKKQLMIAAASQSTDLNEAEIERRVLDYKYALIVHSFEKKYIDKHLHKEVDYSEILTYYNEKPDNFVLKQNIIRCVFAQIPITSPHISTFRKDLKAYSQKKEGVARYASQYASKIFLEDSIWVNFDEVIFGTPLEQTANKSAFLRATNFSETSDLTSYYFLLILDYKLTGTPSPLEFVEGDIQNIILNKRKIILKKELEERVYEDAKQNNLFEIPTK